MKENLCPYCKESIRAEAVICRHCHLQVFQSREQRLTAVVLNRAALVAGQIAKPAVSACGALCYSKFQGSKAALNQCLDDCKAEAMVETIVEKLQRELVVTFVDIIWGGGDIDPLPFEREVRERFGRGLGRH